MEYYFAPMEGVTGAIYRRIHHTYFPGADAYYMPFLTPTRDRVFTPRDLRETAPEHNRGFRAVPQLLTRDPGDFCWAANALFDMGYDEVNLNLGCPSGTVVAKGKGAGLLGDLPALEALLEGIFAGVRGPVSVKTRLGLESPEEFGPLLELFARYPISLLIVHPRVRKDFYREPVRRGEFARACRDYPGPLCYNGGLRTKKDCEDLHRDFPRVQSLMLGQGLLRNPALIRQARGGSGPGREELAAFHDALYRSYLEAFRSGRNTVFHMKELWSYWGDLFEGGEKLLKQIRKAQDTAQYESAAAQILRTLPVRGEETGPLPGNT